MPTYKTPDVYVEEISNFPPSVAEVETAIPAFIGYTEYAQFRGNPIGDTPTRIDSLVEYHERFGGGPPLEIESVNLDANNNILNTKLESRFYMYDSLRLFFKNGGGKCYIISIGPYQIDQLSSTVTSLVDKADFERGLAKLAKEDEPTIILFPDAVLLSGNGLYELQQAALAQCGELMDRVAILDLKEGFGEFRGGIQEFRDQVGINNLKYGAAYTPYLKTNLPKSVKFADLTGKIFKGGLSKPLAELVPSNLLNFNELKLVAAMVKMTLEKKPDEIKRDFELKVQAFRDADPSGNDDETAFVAVLQTFLTQIHGLLNHWANEKSAILTTKNLVQKVGDKLWDDFLAVLTELRTHNKDAESLSVNANLAPTVFSAEWGPSPSSPPMNSIFVGASDAKKMEAALDVILRLYARFEPLVQEFIRSAIDYERALEQALREEAPIYKNIVAAVSNALTVLPPSGAIAGVYAAVDNARGVWKAPANVSLNTVAGLTETITSKDQEELNVDVVAGKSINAIRFFTGRGIIVWGARTLAGNDNEWRYVSVRRFFNMVEESIKKSTYWAVFEPNDAQLWVKLRAMIGNYLTEKWREGALAGAKPEHAFFVNVGLGVTMTPQDILEGRLIIEIGLAAVRPAEFIVLRFSHKMQES